MDSSEIRTLRHKRYLLVTSLVINDDVIQHLSRLKLMTPKIVASIQEEPSNMLKMAKYLDLLEASVGLGKNVFNRFCQFLLDRFPSIHDEVRVELKAVQGELSIESYVREEAHVLVQREFSNIKRLRDIEKKEIEDLVAMRMQVHKEIWTRAIEEATHQQQKEKTNDLAKKGTMSQMGNRVESIILSNGKQGTRAHKQANGKMGDIEGTESPLTKMKQLVKDIESLKELSLKNMAARSVALDEKSRALRVLGASTTATRLDKEVEATLEPLDLEEKEVEAQMMLRQHQTELLRTRLKEIEDARREEEEELDERIRIQKDQFETTHGTSLSDRNQMFLLQRQLTRVLEHLSQFQSKSTMLYRGRSMGYATNRVLERMRALRAFTSPNSQASKTPRRVVCSRSLDRKPALLSHRSTT